MRKVKFTNWWDSRKAEQSIDSALAKMDLFNKTRYGRRKIIDETLLIEAAKDAHENGLVYYSLIFENVTPYCYLEINKDYFNINFLDGYSRKYMSYAFHGKIYNELYGDKLFLSSITFWEFEGSTDKMLVITDHIFKPDGTFLTIERDLVSNEQINSEAKNKIDVTSNWEDYPEFGQYDSIIRKER